MDVIGKKLTVLLPLKGREGFTLRWLSHHARIGLGCKILIGDGDPNSTVPSALESLRHAHALDYEYLRFDDADIVKFYEKLSAMAEAVETPYVMLADNDDFILPEGVSKAISFLQDNQDYVSCGGANLGIYGVSAGFEMADFPQPWTPEWANLKCIYHPLEISHDSAEERVSYIFHHYQPIWYCVHRTEVLRQCLRAVLRYGIRDVLVMELFLAAFVAAKGKVSQTHDFAVYLRQLNSSILAVKLPDIFDRMFLGTMIDDGQKTWAAVAQVVAEEDAKPVCEVEKSVAAAFVAYERHAQMPKSDWKQKIILWARPWLYTMRAKIPLVHRAMQWFELRRVLRTVGRNPAGGDDYRHRLKEELLSIVNSMKGVDTVVDGASAPASSSRDRPL